MVPHKLSMRICSHDKKKSARWVVSKYNQQQYDDVVSIEGFGNFSLQLTIFLPWVKYESTS